MAGSWKCLRTAPLAALLCNALVVAAADAVEAGPPPCGTPVQAGVRWSVTVDAAEQGFAADALCDALRTFASQPRNLHGLVVERRGRLVAEAYRTGSDRSTYSLWARRTRFDAHTLHDVRSVTKSVVGLLWGIAQAEGHVPAVTTPVLDLLPALADLRQHGRERISIANLLCMRSGLAWDEGGGYRRLGNDESGLLWRGDLARYVFDRPLRSEPGTGFHYNGGLSAVLGLLIAERTGMDLQDYARSRLFEPLGIEAWDWVGDLRGRTRAYTGLRLRPRDLARLGRLVLDGGRWHGRQLVPADWIAAMLTPCVPDGDHGYHWHAGSVRVGGRVVAWRGALGNGGQRLFLVPSLDLVVVTTAGEYDDGTVGGVQRYLLEQVVAATREHAVQRAVSTTGVPGTASGAASEGPAPPVETRAVVRSIAPARDGQAAVVHLKLVPQGKLPFTTLRFRVEEPSLLAGLREGDSVKFRAARRAGENTLLSVRAVPPCVQFQPCD